MTATPQRHELLQFATETLDLPWSSYVFDIGQDMQIHHEVQTIKDAFGRVFNGNASTPRVIFDVGAWNGENTIHFYEHFPSATIHTFEASPSVAAQTSQRLLTYSKHNGRIRVIDKAISDHDGTISFYSSHSSAEFAKKHGGFQATYSGSTLCPDRQAALKLWGNEVDFDLNAKQTVKCTTLETYCKQAGLTVDVMHVDVQGAEAAVILGLGLIRPRIIIAETGNVESQVYQGASKPQVFDQLLFERGYKVFRIFKNDTVYVYQPTAMSVGNRTLTYQKLSNPVWRDFHGPYYEAITRAEISCLNNLISLSKKEADLNILELGSGVDVFTDFINTLSVSESGTGQKQITLVDCNEKFLHLSKQLYPNAEILQLDLNKPLDATIASSAKCYDIILACGIAYHLYQIGNLLQTCESLVSDNGIVIFTSYHPGGTPGVQFCNVTPVSSIHGTPGCRYTTTYLEDRLKCETNLKALFAPKQEFQCKHPDYSNGTRTLLIASKSDTPNLLNLNCVLQKSIAKASAPPILSTLAARSSILQTLTPLDSTKNIDEKTKIVDLFVKTYPKDYKWLPYMIRSVQKHCTGFRRLVLISDEIEQLKQLGLENYLTTMKIDYKCAPMVTAKPINEQKLKIFAGVGAGYVWQQLVKLRWYLYSDADFAFMIDSDTIVHKPLSADSLFVANKPKWFLESWNSPRVKACGSTIWKPLLDHVFQTNVLYEAMCQQGFIVSRQLAIQFEHFIRVRFGKDLESFVFESPHNVSEYNLLGTFALMQKSSGSSEIDTNLQSQINIASKEYNFDWYQSGKTEWALGYNSRTTDVLGVQKTMEQYL